MPASPPDHEHVCADGARYALLRRLAPALRHEAVAALQPIAMATGILERRLHDPAPNLTQVQDTATRLAGYSRSAVQSCLDLIEWIAPGSGRSVSVQAVVRSTLDLVRGNLSLRGFTLREELHGADSLVRHAGLRYVLPACLLWLTDSAGSPAEVTLRAQNAEHTLHLVLALQPTTGAAGAEEHPAYRPLRQSEVTALAQDAGIALHHQGDTLSLALTRAASP